MQAFRLIGFSENDFKYANMTEFVRTNLDIRADGTSDPAANCDAISLGLGFTARQVEPGKAVKVDDPVECAGDAGADGGVASPADAGEGG